MIYTKSLLGLLVLILIACQPSPPKSNKEKSPAEIELAEQHQRTKQEQALIDTAKLAQVEIDNSLSPATLNQQAESTEMQNSEKWLIDMATAEQNQQEQQLLKIAKQEAAKLQAELEQKAKQIQSTEPD